MPGRRALPVWLVDSALLLEAFVAINLGFLALDIYVAHSVNEFRHPAEWIPFYFSIAGAIAITTVVVGAIVSARRGERLATASRDDAGTDPAARAPGGGPGTIIATGAGRLTGIIVGWTSITVGVAGLLWHLGSHFFHNATLKNLVYSAPFIAPLAYTGVGLLLLTNRLVPHGSKGWARWVLFFAWGGFLGNFGLSLLDHAQNGFFFWTEWIPVAVSALAVGFTLVLVISPPNRLILATTTWGLIIQAATGLLGLVLHLRPLLDYSSATLFQRIVHGPPLFAPLLFINLSLLAAIGVWEVWRQQTSVDDVAARPTPRTHAPQPSDA